MAKKIILLLALIILMSANVEAAEEEAPFDSLATTYVEGSREVLELVRMKEDGSLLFLIASRRMQGVALVPYSRDVYDFYLNKDEQGNYLPLIFGMILPAEQRGQVDDDLGDWQENVHLLPIYALFDVKDGQIICDKPFHSARGLNPTHYHKVIRNTDHAQLIEILMTHMPRLHERIESSGVELP